MSAFPKMSIGRAAPPQRNFRIGYVPGAVVGHPARRNWNELKNKWLRINAETYALIVREKHGQLKWLLRALALAAVGDGPFGKGFPLPADRRIAAKNRALWPCSTVCASGACVDAFRLMIGARRG